MTSPPDPRPDQSRRVFVTRAAYMAPAILTLAAAPSYAKAGSEKPYDPPGESGNEKPASTGRHKRKRPKPPAAGGGSASSV